MNSTFGASRTGFVPETITGNVSAGQDWVDRYRSRFDMKRTTGNADQGSGRGHAADQHVQVSPGQPRSAPVTSCLVPVFYRAQCRRPLGQQHTDTGPVISTTACSNCHRYVALLPTDNSHVLAAYDFEPNGFTASERRHACGESDRTAYGPGGMTEPVDLESLLAVAGQDRKAANR